MQRVAQIRSESSTSCIRFDKRELIRSLPRFPFTVRSGLDPCLVWRNGYIKRRETSANQHFDHLCSRHDKPRRHLDRETRVSGEMKVTYTSYTAVAEWKWDLPGEADDTCGICRVQFEGTCAKCKYPGEDCPISKVCTCCLAFQNATSVADMFADIKSVIGACTHCFHMHCISDWISSESSQGKCPMCRQVFKEKVADTAGSPNARGSPEAPSQTPANRHRAAT